MAAAVIDRAWRESSPDEVEQDLGALWRELAAASAPVTRAVMGNLIVFRYHERRARAAKSVAQSGDAALESVVALHPSRAVVIEHERGEHDPQAPFAAGVGISVFGSTAAPYGVERIVIRSACAEVSLPSIIRRFIHGDRPTSLWWTEDLSKSAPSDALVDLARQLVYDSRNWRNIRAGFRAIGPLAASKTIDLADLNWRRLAPFRRALVHAVSGLHIDHSSLTMNIVHRPGDAALAWLLAGWVVARLRLAPHEWPTIEEARGAQEFLTLTVDDGVAEVTTALNGHRVLISQKGAPPVTVPAADEDPAEAVAAELRSLSRDTALAETIHALTQHVR